MSRQAAGRWSINKVRLLAVVPLVAVALPFVASQAASPVAAASTVIPSKTLWTASGPPSYSVDLSGAAGTAKFSYDAKNYVNGTTSTWTFQTNAADTGTVHADYTYDYSHDWCKASAHLEAFVKDATGTTVWTKVLLDTTNPCTASPYDGEDHHNEVGAVEFPVTANFTYGFTVAGSNRDSDHHLEGSLTARNLATTTPAGPPPLYNVTDAQLAGQNTSWTTAALLPEGTPGADGTLAAPGEARWYKFPVQPGGQVQVDLSNLDQNYDLTMFKDIGAAFTTLATVKDLTKLSAAFAGDVYSPSIYSPSIYSPSIYSPSIYSPSIYSPSIYSPSIYSPSIYSPSIYSPSIYSPSIYSPSIYSPSIYSPSIYSPSQAFLDAFASAQTRSLIAVSAREGASPESIRTATWNNTGYFYVRVYGRNGISSPTAFHLNLTTTGGPCSTATPPIEDFAGLALDSPSVPLGTPGLKNTVILTDSLKFDPTVTQADLDAMKASLNTLAAATNGVVVDVATSPRIQALNVQANNNVLCAYAKNMVAQAIRELVNSYRDANGTLKYVVIAGGDSVIPFFRYADGAGLGPESDYVPPVKAGTASNTSLNGNFALGQDAYGSTSDLSIKGGDLPIPDLAVGRLVETPAEITNAISTYVSGTTIAPIKPTSSLVTGYDFLTSAAKAVQGNFNTSLNAYDPVTGTGADTLITDQGVKTTDTTLGTTPTPDRSWTATDLKTKLSTHHDLVFLAGHFSANSALAADYKTSIITTDFATPSNPSAAIPAGAFTRSLVFSAGCHSGYNLLDGDGVQGLTLGLDWAELMAQQGATFIGGTGYQYADTDVLAYSARIYSLLSDQLRTGSGAVPVGQALVKAKLAYLASIGNPTGVDQKSLIISTLYGLPMLGVDMPGARIPAATPTGVTPAPIPTGPAKVLGTNSYALNLNPTLTPNTKSALGLDGNPLVPATNFSWLSGPDGVQTAPGLPALPKQIVDVTSTNVDSTTHLPTEVLRGVGFFSGTYSDKSPVLPLTGAPTTEQNGIHTNFASPVFYPQKQATVNYTGDLATGGDGRTRLVVNAAQYRSDPGGATTDTERSYSALGLQLFYSGNTKTYSGGFTPALAAAPSISAVDGTATGGTVTVSTHVTGDPSAGIQRVWVTYTGESPSPLYGSWASVDLVQDTTDSTLWTGTFPLGGGNASDTRFIVQALNGVGMVSLDNNLGAYYTPNVRVGALSAPTASVKLDTLPASGAIGSSLAVGAIVSPLLSGNSVPDGTPVTFSLGSVSAIGTTTSGHATATLPLQDAVGAYQVIASAAGATDSAPFSIVLAGTHLTIDPTSPTSVPQVAAVLTGDDGRPIAEQTVVLSLTDGSGAVVRQAAIITDPAGRVSIGGLADGPYTVSATFAGTPTRYSATSASSSLFVDTAKPKIAPALSSLTNPNGANANGWWNGNVDLSWTCTDPSPSSGWKIPCPDPAKTTYSDEGVYPAVTATVSDNAGNTASATSPMVQIDKTPPTIVGTVDPTGSVNGWYPGDVPVSWSCSDPNLQGSSVPGSGLATLCPATTAISGEGTGLTASLSVSDNADNLGVGTSPSVKIDRTAPNTSILVADVSTGWFGDAVPVTLTAGDGFGSGVAMTNFMIDSSPYQAVPNAAGAINFTVTGDGVHPITWWSVDNVGNIETKHTSTVRIDTAAPSITHTSSPAPNGAGWNRAPVTVHFVCTPPPSGLKSCSPDVLVSADVTGYPVNGTAVSNTGKSSIEPVLVNIDTIAPKVAIAGIVAGKTYDLGAFPVAVCTTTDERSGVKTPATASSTIVGSTVTVTCSGATDVADNVGLPVSVSYKVDDINAEGLSRLATKYLKTSKLSNTQSMIDKLNNDLKNKKVCTFILDAKALSGYNLTAAQVADIVLWARKVDTTCPA